MAELIVPPDLVTKFAGDWRMSEDEALRILHLIASTPVHPTREGVTRGGIRWRG